MISIRKTSLNFLLTTESKNLIFKQQIHNRFIDRLYVWGYAALGALG